MPSHNAVRDRREKEIAALAAEGATVIRVNPWHFRISNLHVWTAAGRWLDEDTGNRGRLYGTTVRALLAQRVKTKPPGDPSNIKYSSNGNVLEWILEAKLWPQLCADLRACSFVL